MTRVLSEEAVRLIDGRNYASLATLMRDGSPQVSPVWIDRDQDLILINTVVGRLKHRNVTRDPRVAITVTNRQNPYERLQVRGRVIAQSLEDANDHIDKLARKYLGVYNFPWHKQGERRIILKVEPSRFLFKTRPNIEQ